MLTIDAAGGEPAWQQVADAIGTAIRSGTLRAGEPLPSVRGHVFSNDPMGANPWKPDWASHKASDLAAAAGVKLSIKGLRHYTASQLLAARFDLRNTAARLGHGGGATTLRHYADPVSEVDREPPLPCTADCRSRRPERLMLADMSLAPASSSTGRYAFVAGDIPATKVREDEDTVAFVDVNPQAPVHLLVIPRSTCATSPRWAQSQTSRSR
jgi:HIT domain